MKQSSLLNKKTFNLLKKKKKKFYYLLKTHDNHNHTKPLAVTHNNVTIDEKNYLILSSSNVERRHLILI